jgi:hypothetical protein
MATERDFELLDDYVANRLSEGDKSAFEKKLEGDPDLQRENMIQQRLVKAIKDARIAELKTMLNNTPIPAGDPGGTSVVAKIAMGTFVAGLVATGVYFYFNQEEESVQKETVELKSENQDEIITTDPIAESPKAENTETEKTVVESGKVKTPAKEENTAGKKPVISVYDPSDEIENTADVEEPATERRNSVRGGAPSIAVQVESENRKYNFNYQFAGGKVILYGPFEKNLYEILEFFSDEKRTVFLYYKDKYYLLKEDDSVNELSPITDVNLIKKLKEYRGN